VIHIDVRREWIDDSSNYYSKEDTISDVKENFDIRRYYSAEGKSVIIDTITTQVIIQSHSNPLNEGKYDKKIHMPIDTIVNTGSIVEWENNKWIIVSNIDNLQAYKTASMIKSNNTLQFYSPITSTLHTIPCIVSKGLISLDEQKIISTLDSEIAVQISNTSITRQIGINNVYKIGLRNYSVTDINDITINGLLLLKMVYSEVSQPIPIFSLEILNGTSIQVNENDPLTINAQVKIDGIVASTMPDLLFSSSDITKATINSTGVVTILNIGGVNFSCKMADNLSVMDVINVEIVSDAVDNYTLEISGSNFITKTYSSTYNCVFRNNGIVVSNISEFYLTADDGVSVTSLASIVSQDGVANNCIVKGLNLGYIRLFARSQDGSIVSDGFRVQIKSLF